MSTAIHYFTLAANQNHLYALFILGLIYYKGKYIQQDIQFSINYLSILSDLNFVPSQNLLEVIY